MLTLQHTLAFSLLFQAEQELLWAGESRTKQSRMFQGRVQEGSQFLELQASWSNSLSPQLPWIFPPVSTGGILLRQSCVCPAL